MAPILAQAVSTQFDHLQSQTSQTLELLSMLWWDIDYTLIIILYNYIYTYNHVYLYMQSCAYFLYILTFTIIYLCWYFWFDPFSSRKIGMESTNRGSSDPPRRSFVSQANADKAPTGWSSYRCDHFLRYLLVNFSTCFPGILSGLHWYARSSVANLKDIP